MDNRRIVVDIRYGNKLFPRPKRSDRSTHPSIQRVPRTTILEGKAAGP